MKKAEEIESMFSWVCIPRADKTNKLNITQEIWLDWCCGAKFSLFQSIILAALCQPVVLPIHLLLW